MGGGAVIAAAAAARRRRQQEIVDAFRLADATSPDRARPIEMLGIAPSSEANDYVARGVIIPGREPGTFYLDEAGYIANRDLRSIPRRIVIVIAMILVAVGAILVGVVARGQ